MLFPKSSSPDNLETLKNVADKASINSKAEGTAKALEDANNEMVDSRDAVNDAYEARDAAQAVVESNSHPLRHCTELNMGSSSCVGV